MISSWSKYLWSIWSLVNIYSVLSLGVLLLQVFVTLVAISQDGSMMSTVEVKLPEEGIGGLVCLKFWALGSENKKFSLSTVIYEPHRLALAYIPENSNIFSGRVIFIESSWCCFQHFKHQGWITLFSECARVLYASFLWSWISWLECTPFVYILHGRDEHFAFSCFLGN